MRHAPTLSGMPAIAGGDPAFGERLRLVRPSVPALETIIPDLNDIMTSGLLTNGDVVRRLESLAAERIGVAHCVAVSSCTAGLMLVLRASELAGEVIVPSFTFAATAHAVVWNGLAPIFADIDPASLTLSAESASRVVGGGTAAILATHTYGTPCDTDGLHDLARAHRIPLFFDAAHAFGSRHRGVPVGRFGNAEVFSLSPTKLLVAGEGGLITTDDDELAERCRIGRDYGNPGDYDCLFVGMNARMSELHAALALASLTTLDERIERRNALATLYRDDLRSIPGVAFPQLDRDDHSTYKDFTILIDRAKFGLDPDRLAGALAAEGIETRRYYSPPVHRMRAYRAFRPSDGTLPVTERVAASCLTLPMWEGMRDGDPPLVAAALRRIHEHATAGATRDSPPE